MGTRKLLQCIALLAVLAVFSTLLCSAADIEQPSKAGAAAAVQPEASSSCRVAFPNTCICQAGSCAGCEQCAGCPDNLCVAAPEMSDAPSKGTRNADAVSITEREDSSVARRSLQQTQQSVAMRSLLQSDILTCDGTERTIILPTTLDPYGLPNGVTCGRPNGGSCATQAKISCKPYTDANGLIGPITFGQQPGQAPLLVHPENPLVFTMAPGLFMTYVAWRVYDVGTGGARIVGKYPAGSQIANDKKEHAWTLPPGPIDGAGNCDACTNCTLGFGIQDMTLQARAGTGYASFELSQMYAAPLCGKSCFDLDGSYWSGMTYSCVQATCGDTDLGMPGNQKYTCPAGYTYNMDADSSTDISDTNCCTYDYTCGDISPLPGKQPFPCLAVGGCDAPPFENNCWAYDPKNADEPIDANNPNKKPEDFVPICCTKKSPPASIPDVYVIKQTVAPKSKPVGSQFTFTIEVGVKGLSTAVARNVVLEDEVPAGLLLDSAQEITTPGEKACQMVTARKFRCTWPVLLFKDIRTVQVTVTGQVAGDYTNTAFVKSSSGDLDDNNNQDSDTLQVKGACCNSRVSPPSCTEVPSKAACPDPNTFYKDKNCNEVPCGPIPGGACCLELLGQCIERTYESACSAAGGAWYKGKLCDQLRQQGICKQPHGACCNVRSGECSEEQLITQCDLKWSTWWKDGSCSSDGYCSGSCCDTANGNCYQSKKADCSKPTQLWTIYGQCDPLKCPNGDSCTPPWYKCKPKFWGKADECCPGYECAEAPKGCKVGKFVCQPKFTPSCGKEGFSCGGKSGAVCCEGYACYWDYKQHKGSCHPEPNPDYCRKDGDQCADDRDCCYGSRCCYPEGKNKKATKRLAKHGGQCTPVTHESCHKDCYDYECYMERRKDCDAYYATSAAKLSAAGAKYMV